MSVFRRPDTAFSLDPARRRIRRPREKLEAHLDFIRSLPCLVSPITEGIEAAHIRYGEPRFAKPGTGIGEKSHDFWTVPLSVIWHRYHRDAQHSTGDERGWWQKHNIDPVLVALGLWANTGDYEAGCLIIQQAQAGAFAWR